MNPGALLDELAEVLEREAAVAARLLRILEREHTALAAGETNTIGEIAAEKRLEISALEEAGRQRSEFLAAAALGPDRRAIESFIETHAQGRMSRAARSWQELRSLAAACEHQNKINGAIILAGHRQAQQALAILQGQMPGGVHYGPDGAALQIPPPSTLATA